jgi:hypothetical protein
MAKTGEESLACLHQGLCPDDIEEDEEDQKSSGLLQDNGRVCSFSHSRERIRRGQFLFSLPIRMVTLVAYRCKHEVTHAPGTHIRENLPG